MNQRLVEDTTDSDTLSYKPWGEFVEDLWTDKLAHLREGGEEEEEEEEEEKEEEEEEKYLFYCLSLFMTHRCRTL